MENLSYLIHDFIGWSFYDNIIGHDVDLVYKCYLIYCSTFGIETELNRRELNTNICKEYQCMISKGQFIKSCVQ